MRSPQNDFRNDRPYNFYEEYLSELSVWTNLKIQDYLKKNQSYYEGAMGSFDVVLQMLKASLEKEGLEEEQSLDEWEELITDRLELNEFTNNYFAIDYVAEKLGMDKFGKTILVFSLMASLNSTYRRIFQYLNEDKQKSFPTLELCGRILKTNDQTFFDMYNKIYTRMKDYRILFPKINVADEYMTQQLICDERFLDILLGKNRCIPNGVDILEEICEDPLWFREKEQKELESFAEDKKFPIFMVCGEKGVGKKQLVRSFAEAHDMQLVLFDACAYERMGEDGFEKMLEDLQYAVRECVLWTMPLIVQGIDGFEKNLIERLLIYLKEEVLHIIQLIFVLLNTEKYTPETSGIYVLPLRQFDEMERIELWNYYRKKYLLEEEIQIEEVANTFILTPGQMKNALYQASISSGGIKKMITKKVLYQVCYEQLHHKLGEKTEKVTPSFAWEDLKMEASNKQILADICHCVKNKHTVMSQWNFSKVVPYGAGITVLFSGPPGTGKTMAAQVIANELQMELYKIDLSQLIDKYVGETEKNIKMIFEQAQKKFGYDRAIGIYSLFENVAQSAGSFIFSYVLLIGVKEGLFLVAGTIVVLAMIFFLISLKRGSLKR